MNKFFSITKVLIYLLVISGLTVTSCNKANEIEMPKLNESNTLVFSTQQEFKETLDRVISLNENELCEFEKLNGFSSLGISSENFYRSIDFEQFKTKEEIISFINENSRFLQLVEDDYGDLYVETVLCKSPFRYFANDQRLFQIGNDSYKVFNSGIVKLTQENSDVILKMNDDDYLNFINHSDKKGLKDVTYNCGTSKEFRVTNDNNRTLAELDVWVQPLDIGYNVIGNCLIRPYKKTLGIWYWCTRTITAEVKLAVDYTNSYNVDPFRFHTILNRITRSDSKVEVTVYQLSPASIISAHFGAYYVFADTPSTSPAIEQECNSFLFDNL